MGWANIGIAAAGVVIGAVGDEREASNARGNSLAVVQAENMGALERQNDQQAFEQFLIDRQNVAGGPAYGGPSGPTPNFWFGLDDQAREANIAGFFEPLQPGSGQVSRRNRAPLDVMSRSNDTRLDPNVVNDYSTRDEYQNPLHNLREFLGTNKPGQVRRTEANKPINPPTSGGG